MLLPRTVAVATLPLILMSLTVHDGRMLPPPFHKASSPRRWSLGIPG